MKILWNYSPKFFYINSIILESISRLPKVFAQIPRSSHPGVFFRKRYSEHMKQIYRRTLMPKCDFNNVAKQLYWNRTLAWVFSCKFAVYFQNTFS